MAEQIIPDPDPVISILVDSLQPEIERMFGAMVTPSYSKSGGSHHLAWHVMFNSRPKVDTTDLVRIVHRTIMSFVDPLDEPDAVLALREKNLQRQRDADRWHMDNEGEIVIKIPSGLEETIDRTSQPVGDLKTVAQRIVHRNVENGVCTICQQAFTLGDRRYDRVADEDIGVVHTYCASLLRAGKMTCCPAIPGFGTGRDFALGRACNTELCEARRSAENVGEIVSLLLLPMVLNKSEKPSALDLPSKAADYVGSLGKRFMFDVLDIGLDLAEFGFAVRVQSLSELRIDEVVLSAYLDEDFGLSSRDIAVALHRLVVGKPYEFKYSGMGYTMRDIADEIRGAETRSQVE
jgi:hypothetical protein